MTTAVSTTTLGAVVDLVMGQAPSSEDTNFDGLGTPFVKVGEFGSVRPVIREWTTNPLRLARRTDVLLCVVGATCGKINLGEECAIGRSVAAIRPNPSKLDQLYLYFFMQTIVMRLRSGSIGAAQTVISREMVESVEIPVPPLAEQRRIVGLLNDAFRGLASAQAHAEKNLQSARALFESHLQSVFTQRGKGWVEDTLQAVVDKDCTLSYGIVQPGNEYPGGLPVVRPTDLTDKVIVADGLKRIDPKRAEGYRRTTLRGGELLLCVRGSTGVVSVAAPELAGANVTRGIVPITFLSSVLHHDFGYFLVTSEAVQSQVRAKTYGAALMQINIGDLRKLTVTFPPLMDQKRLAVKLSELSAETQRLESLYQKKLTALAALRKSLLHQAFSGHL